MTDKVFEGISYDSDENDLSITFTNTLSGGDIAILDAIAAASTDLDLDVYKATKCGEIDAKTVALIMAGFDFGGDQMSASIYAQSNANGLLQKVALLTFPVGISTL